MVYLYEDEWEGFQNAQVGFAACPWCGKQHEVAYQNQEEQPVFYQGKAYCAACYQQLQNNAML